MLHRTGLLLATGITAFLLVGVGFITSWLRPATADPAPVTSQTLDANRETAYQQALAEAQAKLEQANAQIAEANARLSQQNQTDAPEMTSLADSAATALSAEQVRAIVVQSFPGASMLQTPQLIDYQGTPAYEVVLDRGTLYIEAQTGAVLYNGVTTQQARHNDEHDDPHERTDHDD